MVLPLVVLPTVMVEGCCLPTLGRLEYRGTLWRFHEYVVS